MTVTTRERDEVAATVEQWRQGFAAADPEALTELWAGDSEQLVYVADERSVPLGTRNEIARYYHDALSPVDSVMTSEIADLTIDPADSMARVFFSFRYTGKTTQGEEFAVDLRATAVLRRHQDGWRFVQYHESSPGPL